MVNRALASWRRFSRSAISSWMVCDCEESELKVIEKSYSAIRHAEQIDDL